MNAPDLGRATTEEHILRTTRHACVPRMSGRYGLAGSARGAGDDIDLGCGVVYERHLVRVVAGRTGRVASAIAGRKDDEKGQEQASAHKHRTQNAADRFTGPGR